MPGCSIPDDNAWIMRRMRVDQDTFNRVVLVVLDEFFTRKSGRVSNARMMREFSTSSAAHEKRVLAGKRGGTAKALKSLTANPSNAKAMPYQPEPEPEPELDSKREAKASPKNGSRLPKDWFLPASWGQWAVAEGVSQEVARAEADRFKDYWVGLAGAKARKADWEATWRNWIRKTIADAKPKLTAITGGQYVKPNKEQQRLDAFIRGARNTS